MKFELTEDQKILDQGISEMLTSELTPDVFRETVYHVSGLNKDLWKAASEFGLCGLLVPDEFGGFGLGLLEAVIAMQRAGHCALPLPLTGQFLATLALVHAERSELSLSLLPALATGELIACCAFENSSVSDDSSDSYAIQWVEFSADADILLLCSPQDGVGIVDLRDVDVELIDSQSVDLSRPSQHIKFPKTSVQRLEGVTAEQISHAWRILLAADSWGISRFIIETTSEYAVTRKQFGRFIGEFQSVKHPLAEAEMVHRFSESMLWSAASLWGGRDNAYEEIALLCKSHISENSSNTMRDCIQLMGAYGFSWESDLHVWHKRAVSNASQLGTPGECRRMLAAKRNWA